MEKETNLNKKEKGSPEKDSPRPIPLFDILGRPNFPSFCPGDLLDKKDGPWLDEL